MLDDLSIFKFLCNLPNIDLTVKDFDGVNLCYFYKVLCRIEYQLVPKIQNRNLRNQFDEIVVWC